MAGTLRERRKLLLRDEILHAAQQLVAEKGYAAMSMDDLAARVGISKPTLYSHFATKESLVVAAAIRDMQSFAALLEGEAGAQTPLERLAHLMRELLQRQVRLQTMGIGPMPEVMQLLCANEDALAYIHRFDRGVRGLVEAGQAQGEIDPSLDPAAVSRALYGLTMSMHPNRQAMIVPLEDPAAMAEALVGIFVRGVGRR
jgi:AcrR family transcriptional regulator